MKKVIAGLVIIIALGLGITLYSSQWLQKRDGYSNREIIDAITHDNTAFLNEGKPIIEIASIKQPEKSWYVAVIKSIHEDNMEVPVMMVLTDKDGPNNTLTTILGPDTHFTKYQQLKYNIPDSVMQELESS